MGAGRAAGAATAFFLAFLSTLLCGLALSAQAGASEQFRIDFEDNRIVIGPVENLPIDQVSRGASIEGSVDSKGRVTVPKGKFTLPVLGIDEPVRIRGFMDIEDEANGTWDPRTGKLEIQARAGLWLSIDLKETIGALEGLGIDLDLGPAGSFIGFLGDLTCGFSPMEVTFTTESTALGSGQRFTRGLNGPGALTAGWSQLGPFAGRTKVLGVLDACQLIRGLLPGLISTSLQGILPAGVDLGGLDIAGLLANLDDVDLGPSAITISRVTDVSRPASLKMATLRRPIRLKAGGQVRIPVRVNNPGDVPAARVKVCPRLPKASRTTGRCLEVGTLGPGRSVSRSLVVRAARPKKSRSKRKRKPARVRSVGMKIVVTGSGLPTQTTGVVLRVVG